MDKQNVKYLYNGLLFSYLKEWSTDNATTWMTFENLILSERC
jgi:hypothetical protein